MYRVMKIYYDKVTGEVVWNVSYNEDVTVDFDRDYETVKTLNERTKESLALLVLHDGKYEQDFKESLSHRINVTTKELEFYYPDPNKPSVEPVYRPSMSEELEKMKARLKQSEEALDFLLMGGM